MSSTDFFFCVDVFTNENDLIFKLALPDAVRQNGKTNSMRIALNRFLFKLTSNSRGRLMHVISRAEKESIEIGEDIKVTVLEICDDFVRVGISSAHHEPCYREVTLRLATSHAELLLN